MPVNTAALKTFAPAMRRQLLEAVGRKLDLLLTSQTPDTLSTFAKCGLPPGCSCLQLS
jgi:hypothetical protein